MRDDQSMNDKNNGHNHRHLASQNAKSRSSKVGDKRESHRATTIAAGGIHGTPSSASTSSVICGTIGAGGGGGDVAASSWTQMPKKGVTADRYPSRTSTPHHATSCTSDIPSPSSSCCSIGRHLRILLLVFVLCICVSWGNILYLHILHAADNPETAILSHPDDFRQTHVQQQQKQQQEHAEPDFIKLNEVVGNFVATNLSALEKSKVNKSQSAIATDAVQKSNSAIDSTEDELPSRATPEEGQLSLGKSDGADPKSDGRPQENTNSSNHFEGRKDDVPSDTKIKFPIPTEVIDKTTPVATTSEAKVSDLYATAAACSGMHNSDAWLKGPRHSNADWGIDREYVERMIVEVPMFVANPMKGQKILEQSICHPQSLFLTAMRQSNQTITIPHDRDHMATDQRKLRLWAVRLAYLAMHRHQHLPARAEALARLNSMPLFDAARTPLACADAMQALSIGPFDYECPRTKYIVMSLGGNGLGANIRGGVIVVFLLALVTNRVVLLVNSAGAGHEYLRQPWPLASCPRADMQCFYQATSPCTVTHACLEQAYNLKRQDVKKAMRGENLEEHAQQAIVWHFSGQNQPFITLPQRAADRLAHHAHALIDELVATGNETDTATLSGLDAWMDPSNVALLRRAADAIRTVDERRPGYNYAAAEHKVHHALSIYAMRPNPPHAAKVKAILDQIVPKGFDPETALGLPIRGSDKCAGESECLNFGEHMQAVSMVWKQHLNQTGVKEFNPAIVFTTEAKSVVAEQAAFASNASWQAAHAPFQFHFVTNTADVTPDTGFLVEATREGVVTADEAMLSSISSLQFQLLPRVSIGNCCSNFHTLLNDFLMEGCGAARENTFVCLQESPDLALRICCGWHHKCKLERKAYLDQLAADRMATA